VSLFAELKRRNVFRVGIAYVVGGWLLLQLTDVLLQLLDLPEVIGRVVVLLVTIGLPVALFFAWAFELTPEGIKKEKDVDRSQSITKVTSQKLNNAIIGLLVVALGYFALDKFLLDPKRDAAEIATAIEGSRDQVPEPVASPVTEKSIAVLPFVNMSSDEEQEYFSDGLSEELLNLLAKVPELRVAARTSSFSFKGQSIEIPEIASRLKVDHVLEGSVRKSGNQIRITAQLIQADSGYHLWSETYDRQLDNIFQIQDEIAIAVVEALKITLLGQAPKASETDPEAYQLFLQGQYLGNSRSMETIPQVILLLKEALEIDPDYAPAWTELAFAYITASGYGLMPIEDAYLLVDEAIDKALEADPTYAGAYTARGASRIFNKFKFKAGIDDYKHAMQLDPGNAEVFFANGIGARVLGQLDKAIRLFDLALERDPLVPLTHVSQGGAYLYAGRLDESEAAYRRALLLSPDYTGGHYRLARVMLGKGDLDRALEEAEMDSQDVYGTTGRAMVYHALGRSEASQRALDDLIENEAGHAAFQIAEVYAYRNEADKAFEWLEQSVVIRDSGIFTTLGNPALLSLRTDPRWQPFLEKLGLLEYWLEMPPEYGGPIE
jgi:TolB-like protein/Tfp pilus assembly protein PilF